MPNWNSIPGRNNRGERGFQDILDALGETKFSTSDDSLWAQIIGGLQIQGGYIEAAAAVSFHAPYEKQVLGVFVNNGNVTEVSLTGFTSSVSGYWWAIGV
jgi:hypothetical protein